MALAYSLDTRWRNRAEFATGRSQAEALLRRKWARELDYRLIKALWAFAGERIAVRFAYEYRDDSDQWFRAYGNENWAFEDDGLMSRHASINVHPIAEADRGFFWPIGRRPDNHPDPIVSASEPTGLAGRSFAGVRGQEPPARAASRRA